MRRRLVSPAQQTPLMHPGAHGVNRPKPDVSGRDRIVWWVANKVLSRFASDDYNRRLRAMMFAGFAYMAAQEVPPTRVVRTDEHTCTECGHTHYRYQRVTKDTQGD